MVNVAAQAWWGAYSCLYDSVWNSSVTATTAQAVLRALDGHRVDTVLDLGCGSGLITRALVDAGYRVLAVDRSDAALRKAKKRCPATEFVCCDVCGCQGLLLQTQAVVAVNFLHLCDDPRSAMRLILSSIVAKGYRVIIVIPSDDVSLHALFRFEQDHGETLCFSVRAFVLRLLFGLSAALLGITRHKEARILDMIAHECENRILIEEKRRLENGELMLTIETIGA